MVYYREVPELNTLPDLFSITTDQEILGLAVNYNAMIFRLAAPFMKGDVLEIGSGIGNFTSRIIESPFVSSVTCFEVDRQCCEAFKERIGFHPSARKVALNEYDFNDSRLDQRFDLVFSSNVLEHIEDDRKTLELVSECLKPGGCLVLYLPAMPCLYGSVDKELAHYRRYNKKMMRTLFRGLPLEIVRIKYFNAMGALGWFYAYRILKRKTHSPEMVVFYDRYIFPFMNIIETALPTFFGANLLVTAKKVP